MTYMEVPTTPPTEDSTIPFSRCPVRVEDDREIRVLSSVAEVFPKGPGGSGQERMEP